VEGKELGHKINIWIS